MGKAMLKSVMPLKFRVCFDPLLGHGLTSEWVNEVSVGFFHSSLLVLLLRPCVCNCEYTFVVSIESSKCHVISFNRNIV